MQSRSRRSSRWICGHRPNTVGRIWLQPNYTPPSWKKERNAWRRGRSKQYKGVGLSHATIHHYVVKNSKVNMSPQKRGPIGHIPALAYKSLCAGFATFMQINQLNCTRGVTHRGKMAPIVADTMMVDVETAQRDFKAAGSQHCNRRGLQ